VNSKRYNIFLSHSWAYSDAYEKLVDLLDSCPNFIYGNYSVPKDDPIHNAPSSPELYDAIKRRIQLCHVVLIMAGVYASYSTWIQNEILIAKEEFVWSKPIIAIKPWAQMNVSKVVSENADELVNWNTSSIVEAIRRHAI